MEIRIEWTGQEAVYAQLDALKGAFLDLRALWPDVADEFFAIEMEMFESEGATNDSGGWAPLNPVYAAWKERNWGTPILQRKGDLLAGLTSMSAQVLMLPDELVIAPAVAYAAYHQFGTSRMPARPVIDLSAASIDRLLGRVQDWVVSRVQEIAA